MGTPELLQPEHGIRSGGKDFRPRRKPSSASARSRPSAHAANQLLFSINGKKILIRGGGWAPDMMLREDSPRLQDEFRYVQDMGLNTIRLEGKLENKEFFDMADEQGILLMAGWCCCDHWEHWPNWKPEDFNIAEQSLRDQIYRLRSHPSLVMWLNGSDNPPPPDVEQTYLNVEKELLWPNPMVSSATAKLAGFSGVSGVKMTGAVRIRGTRLLAEGQNRLDASASNATRADAAGPTDSTPKPAWGRPFPRSRAFAPWWAKTTSGRWMMAGIFTPAAEYSKIFTCSPTPSMRASAPPPAPRITLSSRSSDVRRRARHV